MHYDCLLVFVKCAHQQVRIDVSSLKVLISFHKRREIARFRPEYTVRKENRFDGCANLEEHCLEEEGNGVTS